MRALLSTLKGKIIVATIGSLIVAGIVVAFILIIGPKAYRSIKINQLTGQTVITDEKNVEVTAYAGMNLQSGNKVSVLEKSNLVLLMDADKYMFADAGTKFKLEASGDSEKGNTKTKVILEEGSILCRLDSKLSDKEVFEVETPNSTMAVRGTIFRMSIYQDATGENYTQLDVLEGTVQVDLYMENGEKTGEEGIVEAGQAATVHSNPEISEFVIGESDITYEDFSDVMAEFVVASVEEGQEICIGTNLFKHFTGLENHPETINVTKEATCALEGEREIYCSICDTVVRVETIEKIEHTPGEVEETTEGTCEEKSKEMASCLVCGEKIIIKELEFGEHSYGDWQISKVATCTVEGEETSICEICGDTKTRTVEALGHEFGEWVAENEADCTTGGEELRTCSRCGMTETQTIAALGHSYGAWAVKKEASCTDGGENLRTCSKCGKTETQTVAATGHSYGSWMIQVQPTCESDGEESRACDLCGSLEFQAIPGGTGHNFPEHTASANHSWVPLASDPTGSTLDYIIAEVECSTCKDYGDTVEFYQYNVSAVETRYDDTTGILTYYKCTCGYEYNQ